MQKQSDYVKKIVDLNYAILRLERLMEVVVNSSFKLSQEVKEKMEEINQLAFDKLQDIYPDLGLTKIHNKKSEDEAVSPTPSLKSEPQEKPQELVIKKKKSPKNKHKGSRLKQFLKK